jgi:hypothetical protein
MNNSGFCALFPAWASRVMISDYACLISEPAQSGYINYFQPPAYNFKLESIMVSLEEKRVEALESKTADKKNPD